MTEEGMMGKQRGTLRLRCLVEIAVIAALR